jgi:hypothetical protein
LQAADWLAYEYSKAHEEFEAGTLDSWRWPFEQFNSILGEPTTYTVEDLEQMEKMLKLNREIAQWGDRLGRSASAMHS